MSHQRVFPIRISPYLDAEVRLKQHQELKLAGFITMKKLNSIEDLFVDQLRDLYDAENQLVKALPKMAKESSSEPLQAAFKEHLNQTKIHVERLEQIFQELDLPTKGSRCRGIEGLIEEAEEYLKADGDEVVIDAALIAAAQRVEHYEIAAYGCACAYANMVLNEQAANLLHQTLDEEKQADRKLTEIAQSKVNVEATARTGPES